MNSFSGLAIEELIFLFSIYLSKTLKSRGALDSGCILIQSEQTIMVIVNRAQKNQARLLNPCLSSVTPTAEKPIQAPAKIELTLKLKVVSDNFP